LDAASFQDSVHLNQKGRQRAGQRLAELIEKHVSEEPRHGHAKTGAGKQPAHAAGHAERHLQ
jgi:hypothetical protein